MVKYVLFLLGLCSAGIMGAQTPAPSLDDIMSLEDQKKTGVIRLTEEQKKALASWFVMHGYYDKEGGEETVHALKVAINIYGGKILQLSDNSVYEIAPDDREIAAKWLSAIPVKVTPSNDPNYPFLLTNLHNHLSVKAKKGVLT